MVNYSVRVFEVPRLAMGVAFDPEAHVPVELSPATVRAVTHDDARAQLRSRFEGEGRRVRCISIGLDINGAGLAFTIYLHGVDIE